MSGADADEARADELTERYLAASAADPSRPSDSVRRSIFAYARTLAADPATRAAATAPARRLAANGFTWRVRAAAGLIVAAFATVLAWHFHTPTPVPSQNPGAATSSIAADNPPAPGSTPEPLPLDRRASTAPAPNAVTTRSSERTVPPAAAPRPTHEAAADLQTGGGSVPSSRQAPARAARATAAKNATAASGAIAAQEARDNPTVTAQVAPPAAAPPDAEARRLAELSAAFSGGASAAPSSPLVTAAASGNLEQVDQLLRSGISTEQTDPRGRTALLIATLRSDMPMVRHLLAAGARADVVDADGDTPLAAARRQGPAELARLLEQATHP